MSDNDSSLFPPNDKNKGLFPPNKQQNMFPANKKQGLFGQDGKGKVELVTVDDMLDMEQARIRVEQEQDKLRELIKAAPKRALFRLYNDDDELLYITITNQFQSLMAKDWYWIDPPTRYEVEYFQTRDEQDEAKFMAIDKEKPKWNNHSSG